MFGGAMKLVVSCWRPVEKYVQSDGSEEGSDGIVWFKDIGEHAAGTYSMAVAQANQRIEDHCQVETGPLGTFVGIYDGHGGPDAACFVSDRLFGHLLKVCLELSSTTISHGQKPLQACQLRSGSVFTEYASEQGNISSDAIRKAFLATEEEFLSLVAKSWLSRPQLASVGSCCLVGLIFNSTLYVANLGDSRVVMGRLRMTTGQTVALQLSTEHNASMETVREELQSLHPDDSEVVVLKHGVWRIKGIIQVSRSIGDVYLKRAEFNRDPLQAKFRLAEPLKRPVLSAEPSVTEYKLLPQDRFLIFASDGLWEQLTNQEAVDIVSNHSPEGSAKRLVKAALQVAAKKREMRYADLRNIELGIRRHFHDDISVIVVFLDHNMISKGFNDCPTHSVRSPGI